MSRMDLKGMPSGELVEYWQLVSNHTAWGTSRHCYSTDARPGASDHAQSSRWEDDPKRVLSGTRQSEGTT